MRATVDVLDAEAQEAPHDDAKILLNAIRLGVLDGARKFWLSNVRPAGRDEEIQELQFPS